MSCYTLEGLIVGLRGKDARAARTSDDVRDIYIERDAIYSSTYASRRSKEKNRVAILPRFASVCVTCLSVYTA